MNFVTVLILAALTAGFQQTAVITVTPQTAAAPRDRSSSPSGTGRIRGRVVRADTGAPLRDAQITLSGEPLLPRRATADDDGRYEFTDLPAGRFMLDASQGGYITLAYGQRRPFETGRPLILGDAQVLSQIDFALPRGGVITGRITDEFGEPVTGALIRVERFQYAPGGQRQLTTFAISPFLSTDDRGEFRVFGLMPGDYIVSARLQGLGLALVPGGSTASFEDLLPTYYPGTPNVSEAQTVRVGVSQEVPAHFAMVAGRNVRISGTVVQSNGRPASGMRLGLLAVTATLVGIGGGGLVAADGSFSIGNVPPGDYFLQVRPEPGTADEIAAVPISVRTENLTGLQISTAPGTTITGRVDWVGSAPRPTNTFENRLRIRPIAADGRPPLLLMGSFDADVDGTLTDNDTFLLRGLTGKVIFRAIGLASSWTLKAVIVDGKDIIDTGVDADRLKGDTEFRVIITDKISDLSGSVRNGRGQSVSDYVVVVVPQAVMEGVSGTRYTVTTRPDQSGSFQIRALPPGRYVAAAVDGLEQGREWDPEIQKTIRAAGTSFTIAEGQALTMTLPLLP